MNKREQIIVGLLAGFLCPYLAFVLFWWTAAALTLYKILPISDRGIFVAARAGLALGIILDGICLKHWIACFYHAKYRFLVPVYLFCSLIAVASFMGLPLGNLVMGTLAGVYVGRRMHHAQREPGAMVLSARRACIFAAAVTGLEALPISILALKEGWVMRLLQAGLGMNQNGIQGIPGIGVAIFLCVTLTGFQFLCTRTSARFAFSR
jgi:hypothetical protein